MASKTCGRLYKVHNCVFEPTGSTPSRLPLPFKGPNKLVKAQAPSPRPSNVITVTPGPCKALAAAPAGCKALLRVYLYNEMQDII